MVDRGCRARVESGCSDHTRSQGWAQCRSGPLGRRDTTKAGRGPCTATFRRRGDYHGRQPPIHDGVAPGSGGALGNPVTDPVAGPSGCSGRCWPDGDRVGRQVAARSTRATRQRPCGHSRRLPVGAHGNGARVHGNPGRAGWATTSAVPPGSYPRGDRMDDARGLELALAALPLAQRCAGRVPAGSAAALAVLPLALVPRRATKTPVRGHRPWDWPPRLGRAWTRTNSVALKSLLIGLPIAAAQSSSLELRAAKNRQTTHAGFGLLSRSPSLLGWWVKSSRCRRPRGRPSRHRRADQHHQLEL